MPAFALWLFLVGYANTDWDIRLMDIFFNSSLQTFPERHNWWLETVLHDGLRQAIIWVVMALVAMLFFVPSLAGLMKALNYNGAGLATLQPVLSWQREITWAILGMALSILLITYLKRHSFHACPWDLIRYGGHSEFIPLLKNAHADTTLGHCFPAAHAAGGFIWLAFYFALHDRAPRIAYWMLGLGLVLGNVMGFSQCLRGAHFLSHQLWTLLWIWLVLLVWYSVWSPSNSRCRL